MPIEFDSCLKPNTFLIHFIIHFDIISATSIHSVVKCGTIECLVNVDLNICHVEFN